MAATPQVLGDGSEGVDGERSTEVQQGNSKAQVESTQEIERFEAINKRRGSFHWIRLAESPYEREGSIGRSLHLF
jgi:hypothetical protein